MTYSTTANCQQGAQPVIVGASAARLTNTDHCKRLKIATHLIIIGSQSCHVAVHATYATENEARPIKQKSNFATFKMFSTDVRSTV